ncbi:histidine kinase [Aquiflexum sp.]|uniref:sensor histidine kinase n=1 Tax=Aquiflexum sp. TaxID=1872584 RepID=UPI00359465FB
MWKNFTASDGLPGNEIFEILSDPQGHLWFVGDQGICRFNGYSFVRPVDTSAARGTEAFLPIVDSKGRIWFTRLDGSVWKIENDTVKSWKFNPVIKPYLEKFKPVESLSISENGDVWLAIYGLGFLVVQPNGQHRILPEPSKPSLPFSNTGGKLIYTYQSAGITISPAISFPVVSLQNTPFPNISCLFKHHHYRGIWMLRNGDIWLSCQDSSYMIRNGNILWQISTTMYTHKLVETREGKLLHASHIVESPGLHAFDSPEHLRTGVGINLLPGQQVTYVLIDKEGGWWASTLRNGVFYARNPGAVIFHETKNLSSENITCLTTDGVSTVYAGMGNGHLFAVDSRTEKVFSLPQPSLSSGEVKSLHYDQAHQRLYCSELLHFFEKNGWQLVLGEDSPKGFMAKSISKGSDAHTLWVSSSYGFSRIDTKKNSGERMGMKIHSQLLERTFDVTTDPKGNIWVATLSGLKLWKDSIYIEPPWHHPALRFQPRDIAILPDGGMAISLSGAGLLIRNPDGELTQLTERDGLNSDFITKLYVSPEGDLYTCSYSGINRIRSDGDSGWNILSIDSKKGLPSNHVKDIVSLNDELWVATDAGLVRLRNLPEPITMPAPLLEDLLVNNIRRVYTQGMNLSYDENNVLIRFYALHFRSAGYIPYRYRLNGVDTAYTHATTREVHYARLSPGIYAFEVQAQNEDGEWGKTSIWSFQIIPAWWDTVWFRFVAIVCLLLGTGLLFYLRFQKRHKEALLKEKIREMESAALRAQMNPHFIFNCLGSIQHFISENDPDSAMRYLANFARLVRLALHSSVDGVHTLREEVEMLEHYLTLEQLRFRNKFTFAIKVDSDLNSDDISLPPLLVQPFVENAILHGMKNKTKNGRISIHLFIKDGYLNVQVCDNGPGLHPDGTIPVSNRKSIGMMLTERRLALLAGKASGSSFQIENIVGSDGSVLGTKVVVKVSLGELAQNKFKP